jgi:hypothetical protein
MKSNAKTQECEAAKETRFGVSGSFRLYVKIVFGVIITLGAIFYLVLLCSLGFFSRSEMTEAQVKEMFNKVGGVDEVNQETRVLFRRFSTNEYVILNKPDLTNCPAILSLGKVFSIVSTPIGMASEIEIGFGTHMRPKLIHIFLRILTQTRLHTHRSFWIIQSFFKLLTISLS